MQSFDVVTVKDVKVRIGELVKLMRKRDGLSQEELARLLAMSRITIQNLESGKNATMDTMLKALQHWDLLPTMLTFIDNEIADNNVPSLYW